MTGHVLPDGTYTALITPFSGDAVDIPGLEKNIEFQIASGITGLLPLGTTGETPTLSAVEREQILTTTLKVNAGRVPVMVGTGHYSTAETCKQTQIAEELGADAALIVTPYYNKPTQNGILRHFEAVAKSTDIPIVVYNIQGRTGVNIETSTLRALSEIPQIVGVKEASGNISQIGDVLAGIQHQRPDFKVFSGDDALTLPVMALGANGVISVASNLYPASICKMVSEALSGNFEEARRRHFSLLPLFKALFLESNPVPVKYAMNIKGMAAGECRLPLTELQPTTREVLEGILSELG